MKKAPLTSAQIGALVELIEDAIDCARKGLPRPATREFITAYALENRSRRGARHLTPTQIHDGIGMFLDKLTSGGRIGVAYYIPGRLS